MPKDIFVKIKRKKAFDAQWYLQEKRTDWVLPLVLKARAKTLQNKPFLQYQNQKPLTFKQVNALANRIANGLIKMGIKKGERVASCSTITTRCPRRRSRTSGISGFTPATREEWTKMAIFILSTGSRTT